MPSEIFVQNQLLMSSRRAYVFGLRMLCSCIALLAVYISADAQEQGAIHTFGLPGFRYPGHKDTALVNKWLVRGRELLDLSPDSAAIFYQQALEKSMLIRYTAGEARSHAGLSYVYTRKGKIPEAVAAYETSLRRYELIYPKEKLLQGYAALSHVYKESGLYAKAVSLYRQVMPGLDHSAADPVGLAAMNKEMGIAFFSLGNFDSAMIFFYKALSTSLMPDSSNAGIYIQTYMSLGGIAMRLRQYDQALLYFKYAGKIAEWFGNDRAVLFAMGNIASVYYEVRNYTAAEGYLQRMKTRMSRSPESYPGVEVIMAHTRALILIDRKKYEEALPYCRSMYENALAGARHEDLVEANYLMGCTYVGMGAYSQAIPYLKKGMELCQASGYTGNNYPNLYTFLAYACAGLKDYRQAFLYRDTAASLSDSLYGERNMAHVAGVEMKYRTAEKDRQLAWQQLQINRKEGKLKEKNLWIGGIAMSSLLLVILVGTRYRSRQRLQVQQLKIAHLDARMQGEELERGRIAQELHDGVSVLLSAAKMNYTALGKKYADIARSDSYREVMQLLNETSQELRSISYNLVPEQLIRQSLPAAIQAFCELIQKGHDITVELQSYGSYNNASPEFSYMVYRIVQELIQNVVKHARCSYVLVQLILHDKELHLTVEDNGIGFDSGKLKEGMGLQNLHKRIESVQGSFSISSLPDAGTTVEIEIPLSDR